MKLLALLITLIVSFPSLASTQTLKFNSPDIEVRPVVIRKALQPNLIRLYMRMPSEMRMIAGYKEVRVKEISKTSFLDGLRNRLKTSSGQLRL
jgi:hypothetical protein